MKTEIHRKREEQGENGNHAKLKSLLSASSRNLQFLYCVTTKLVFRISDQLRHEPGVQVQKMARGLTFRIQEEEGLYSLCSEN